MEQLSATMDAAPKPTLVWRWPGWLSLPLASIFGGAMAGGALFATFAMLGAPLSPMIAGAAGGVFLSALFLSVILTPGHRRSFDHLLVAILSIGHTSLLIALVLAYTMAPVGVFFSKVKELLPIPAALAAVNFAYLEYAVVYIALFILYSFLAPVSLICFRYLGLKKSPTV